MEIKYLVVGVLFILLIILLFSFGCTTPVSQEGGYKEVISEVYESDINNDGAMDTATYIFTEQIYNSTTFQRVITVKPKWDLSNTSINIETEKNGEETSEFPAAYKYYFDNGTVAELRGYLYNFDNKRSNEAAVTGEAQCIQYLGLGRTDIPCIDIHSCSQACIGAPICKTIFQFVGEPFAEDLLELNNGFKEMDIKIEEAYALLDELEKDESNIKKETLEEFIEKIEEIYILGGNINLNSIINPNIYGGLCNQINYDNSELQKIYDTIYANLHVESLGVPVTAQIEKLRHQLNMLSIVYLSK